MDNKFDEHKNKYEWPDRFEPPKLPIKWLITAFIAPVIVAFLPYLLSKEEVSFLLCLTIGLALLSTILLVFAFSLILQLYSAEFKYQLLRRDLAEWDKKNDEIKAILEEMQEDQDQQETQEQELKP